MGSSLGESVGMEADVTTRYLIPETQHRVEEEILRSRFITTLCPVETVAEAQAFLGRMRAEFADATHNCWAYLVGQPGSSSKVGMSDDGEPHGTAGRPMLQVLNYCGVGDIACVVTRYYGGTKLGKGGLVRAYSGGVQLALETLPQKLKVYYRPLELVIPYSHVTLTQKAIEKAEIQISQAQYETDVTFQLNVPLDALSEFVLEIDNLTGGDALWDIPTEF